MLRFARYLVLGLLLSASPAAAQTPAFVTGTEDLPLMTGLAEQAEGRMVFDSPNGRIVEVSARGAVSRQAVLSFYAETLPQLGWQRLAPGRFQREDEILKLEFPGDASGQTTVRFTLSPVKAPVR